MRKKVPEFLISKKIKILNPVEKLSPPSDTDESKSRKTLALTMLDASVGASSDGMRWTRRSASY